MKTFTLILCLVAALAQGQSIFPQALMGQSFVAASSSPGEIILVGTFTSTDGSSNGAPANLADLKLSSFWTPNVSTGASVNLDAGTPVVPTRVILAPSFSDTFSEANIFGEQFQGSVDNFSTSNTLLKIPAFPWIPRLQYDSFTLSNAAAYRYLRAYGSTNLYGGQPAELRWVVTQGTTTNARPVAPTFASWGGNFGAGSTAVTMATTTTGSAIYWTTNGTQPTTASALYGGPVTLILPGTNIVLKAVAYNSTLLSNYSETATAVFNNVDHIAAGDEPDQNGNQVWASDGNIVLYNGVYYRVGEFFNLTANPPGSYPTAVKGVWMYSSTNMVNWILVGEILDNTTNNWAYVERAKVYIVGDGTFALWAHVANGFGTSNFCAVAQSSNITNGWLWIKAKYDPLGVGVKDCNSFQDPTSGKKYFMFVDGLEDTNFLIQLNPACTAYDGSNNVAVITDSFQREAPALMKNGSIYAFCTSAANFANASLSFDNRYILNTNDPLTPWPSFQFTSKALSRFDPVGTTMNQQVDGSITLPNGNLMYYADYLTTNLVSNSRLSYMPMVWTLTNFIEVILTNQWNQSGWYGSQTNAFNTNNLLAMYPLQGNANDVSPYGLNGSVVGTLGVPNFAPNVTAGMSLKASAYVQTPAVAITNTTAFSVSMWFYSDSGSTSGQFTGLYSYFQDVFHAAFLGANFDSGDSRQLDAGIYTDGSGAQYLASATGIYTNNGWYHVVMAYDGTQTGNTNRLKVYLNGNYVPMTMLPGEFVPASVPSIIGNPVIGNISAGSGKWYGYIDDCRIYQRTLPQSEAISLYNSGPQRQTQ